MVCIQSELHEKRSGKSAACHVFQKYAFCMSNVSCHWWTSRLVCFPLHLMRIWGLRGWTRENQIVTEDNLDSLQQRCAPSPAIRSWPDEQPTDVSGGYAEVAQSCQVSKGPMRREVSTSRHGLVVQQNGFLSCWDGFASPQPLFLNHSFVFLWWLGCTG